MLPDCKVHPPAAEISTLWSWCSNRHPDKGHRSGEPETDPHKHGDTSFDKDAKAIPWRMDHLFNKQSWSNSTFLGRNKNQTKPKPST